MSRETKGNVVRVTTQRSPKVYVRYIHRMLHGDKDEAPEFDSIIIRGMGRAITSAVNIVEIVKRESGPLFEQIVISSEVIDGEKSNEEVERKVSVICITLSKSPIDESIASKNDAARKTDKVKTENHSESRGGRGKGRGKRGSGSSGRVAP